MHHIQKQGYFLLSNYLMKLVVRLLCILVFAAALATCAPHIELAFSRLSAERQVMFEYFNGIKDQFYVDIGAFHPVDRSNTLMMRSQGWKGINVEGNSDRVKFFYGMEFGDLTLNYGIGPKLDSSIQLHIPRTQSMATMNAEINKKMRNGEVKVLNIPTTGLSQLCERYFYKTPVFMNLDVEGVGAYALLQNNWNDSRCRPETILAESNKWNDISKIGNVQEILESHGYVAITPVGQDILFIEKDSVEKFKKIKEINHQLYAGKNPSVKLQFWNDTAAEISSILPSHSFIGDINYDIFKSSIYLHFAVAGNNLDLDYLHKYSDKIAQPKHIGRPLVIYNYDPTYSSIIIKGSYTIEQFSISENNDYIHIYVERNGKRYEAYIYDHHYLQPGQYLNIIRSDLPVGVLPTIFNSIPTPYIYQSPQAYQSNNTITISHLILAVAVVLVIFAASSILMYLKMASMNEKMKIYQRQMGGSAITFEEMEEQDSENKGSKFDQPNNISI